MRSAAVIGGGITGLTAAFRLRQQGVPVTLYEAGDRVGGVIQSVRQNGFLAESGPNTLLETSPKISSLIADLGLEGRKLHSNPAANNRYLARNGRLIRLPDSPPAFLGTRLFSTGAKLRLLREPFIPPAPPDREESVEQFVLRRLGREFLDYAINPLVGGVYAGDPARLSVRHAFPKLHALEQKHRSLLLGQFLGARERKRRPEVSKQNAPKLSFDEGLQVLTDALRAKLGAAVRLRSPVCGLRQTATGWQVLTEGGGEEESPEYGAVLFAGTAHRLARLEIAGDSVPDLRPMAEIYHPPVASVVLGFRRGQVSHPLDGFGALVPQVEGLSILGVIFSSSLFLNRAPEGSVLLTCYLGGARNPGLAMLERGVQVELACLDLQKLLGVTGEPLFERHFTFPKAIPQFEVGYGRFKNLMNDLETRCPGIYLAGSYRDGISLGDSIVSGHDAAARIQQRLLSSSAETPAAETPARVAA